MAEQLRISGLMSVYHGTDPNELAFCLDSIFKQSQPPQQLVVVFDGPVGVAVQRTIGKHGKKISVVKIKDNSGLGPALNAGLDACHHPLVARFDSDDWFPRERLEMQLKHFQAHPEISILGGQIAEFEKTPGDIHSIRKVPLAVRADAFTLRRNPINHMTVMFRRDAILEIGGYKDLSYMEDYELWLRAMERGLEIANLPDIMAHARIGSGLHGRRRGLAYIKSEFAIFLSKSKLFGHRWLPLLMLSLMARVLARLLPTTALKAVYRKFLRQ